jgi:CIC family chloride channel protein
MSSNPAAALIDRLPSAARPVLRTVLYGLAAGLVAVVFHLGIHFLYANGIERLARLPLPTFLIGSFLVVGGTSALAGWLLGSFCREAAGSGIPQLKAAFWKDFGNVPWRVTWVKLIGGIITVGGGASLGREGPTVQLGGGLSSLLAGFLGEPKQQRRPAAAAGAAAGLAAAFNTPIAAVTFVLEEIIGDLNSRLLGGVLLASVVGAFVAHGFLGEQPAFQLQAVGHVSWMVYVAVPFVALLAASAGSLFQRSALGLRGWNKSPARRLPLWLRTTFGGLAVWAIGAAVFAYSGRLGVFSLGYGDLTTALNGGMPGRDAALLLAAKLAATVVCYGLGGCGGIFAPTLFFGAMTGVAAAGLLNLAVPLSPSGVVLLAVVGMSSCLASVVRAPVTSILIVFEMTHEFAVVPPLMVAALISQAVSHFFAKHNFYDALLDQDGLNIEHSIPPRDLRAWQDAPVSRIANFRPVLVRDTSPAALAQLLADKPYERFPVVDLAALPLGLLNRAEAQQATAEQRAPKLVPVPTVRRETPIREVQRHLIDSPAGVVLVQAGADDRVIGLVTLHDLLRAEAVFAKND